MGNIFLKLKKFLNLFPRHWVVAGSAWTSKIIVSLVNIISIRELLAYLGEERYAVYLVAYSLTGWFALTQFNVGISLQNFISESRAKDKNYDKYMVSALQSVAVLFVFFITFTFFIADPLQNIIFRKFNIVNEPIIFVFGIVSVITFLTNIVYNVYFAIHKGYIPNIFPAAAALISMCAIVLLKSYDKSQNIITALLIFTVPQCLFAAVPFIAVFKKYFSQLFRLDYENFKALIVRSAKFWIIGILGVIYWQTDYIIASQVLPAEEIVKYGIFTRFFLFAIFIYESLLLAVWPVRSEMYVRRDYAGIRGMLKRYSFYAIALIVISSALIYSFSDLIIRYLAPNAGITANLSLIISFCLYAIARTFVANYSAFLQSINALRVYFFYVPISILINVPAQYFFAKIYGAQGLALGFTLSLTLTAVWILPLKTYKVLNKN